MSYIFIDRPAYLKALKVTNPGDLLVSPTKTARMLKLKRSSLIFALNEGILPHHMIDGRRLVCPREIYSILQILNEMQRGVK